MVDWGLRDEPPDEPEPIYCPKGCEDEEGSPVEAEGTCGGLKCPRCGHEWDYPDPGEDPGPEDHLDHAPAHGCRECGKPTECVYCSECADKVKCRHGRILSDGCGECDHESDAAYDAAREDRCRR